jgi:beta-N-acetylhexosaminidase
MRPVIFGMQGHELTNEEREFFLRYKPAGFILFRRNCKTPAQVKQLTTELQKLANSYSGLEQVPILIDQEGGRVARLRAPEFKLEGRPLADFGKLAKVKGIEAAIKATTISHFLMGKQLKELGINVNCAPVADLYYPEASTVIGDRSFGSDPNLVITLCLAAMLGLEMAGVTPIIKHIPGHGLAKVDSHYELPVVVEEKTTLAANDFRVFKELAPYSRVAMTAHVVYEALDNRNAVTLSKPAIEYIREKIGFDGVILTDALEMEALSGSLSERARKSLLAGCDLALHCNGKLDEMEEVAAVLSKVKDIQKRKIASMLSQDIGHNPLLNTAPTLLQYANTADSELERVLVTSMDNIETKFTNTNFSIGESV